MPSPTGPLCVCEGWGGASLSSTVPHQGARAATYVQNPAMDLVNSSGQALAEQFLTTYDLGPEKTVIHSETQRHT